MTPFVQTGKLSWNPRSITELQLTSELAPHHTAYCHNLLSDTIAITSSQLLLQPQHIIRKAPGNPHSPTCNWPIDNCWLHSPTCNWPIDNCWVIMHHRRLLQPPTVSSSDWESQLALLVPGSQVSPPACLWLTCGTGPSAAPAHHDPHPHQLPPGPGHSAGHHLHCCQHL